LRDADDACDIDVVHQLPGVEIRLGDGLEAVRATGVVDEDLHGRAGDLRQPCDVSIGRHVARAGVARPVRLAVFRRQLLEAVLATSGADDAVSLSGEGVRSRRADPAARSGDDGCAYR